MDKAKIIEQLHWDKKLLNLAKFVASWSKDPSTKVGAVIVDDKNRIVSVGYNGFPIGIKDDDRLFNREEKYKMVVHAEMNAILFAQRPLLDHVLYTYPFQPCARCAGVIIQAGIKKVITKISDIERWKDEFTTAKNMFDEAGVKLLFIKLDEN